MLDFIVNPNAGSIKGAKLRKTLLKLETYLLKNHIDYAIHCTNHKNHAKELTADLIDRGATDIVGIGGDGTLHEIVNGFHDFDKCRLGMIPCGTGNDFAGAVGLPKNPLESLKLILKGEAKYTDFMQMPTVRGINIIGTGVDVDVLVRYEKLKRKTNLGYTNCLIKTLFNFDYTEFDAEINGKKKKYQSFIACVANGTRYGGGIRICPAANVSDGKLNFVAIDKMKRSKIVNVFLKLKQGKILEVPATTMELSDHVAITTKEPCVVQVDGELYKDIPFDVTVVHNQLRMYRK